MLNNATIVLDVRALIQHLGGFERIETVLRAAGVTDISRRGLHKWHQRDGIASDRLAQLLYAYSLEGEPVDLYRFVRVKPTYQNLQAR